MRPANPPISWVPCTLEIACPRAAGASCATSGKPGVICGDCWMVPNAAPYAQANSSAVTMVTRRNSGLNSSRTLGRFNVPATRWCSHCGDSGGMAG